MKKRFGICLMILCMCLGMLYPSDTVLAASGATSVSVSSGSVNIGDTVTVSAKAQGPSGEKAVATMTLSYDSGVLQFVSCSTTYGGGGSSVTATSDSFTVTLKAVAAGTSSLSLSGSDGVVFDTNEELDSMAQSSTSVTVNNAAGGESSGGGEGGSGESGGENSGGGEVITTPPAKLSGDNSLKALTISPGTLSPNFSGKTTTYSATVANNVTSIAVNATPANEKAVVESVSGSSDLKVGNNPVKIVVKAENGVTATYTINVTRQGTTENKTEEPKKEEPKDTENETETKDPIETIVINNASYHITGDFKAEDIPTGFSETTVNYHATDYKGVSYEKGPLVMLYLVPENAEDAQGGFYVYDSTRDILYPFVRLGNDEKFVIALLAPVDFIMPDTYQQTTVLTENGGSFTAFQKIPDEDSEIESEFYAFYAVNHEGMEGWYQYDALEGTYQRLGAAPFDDDGEEDSGEVESLQEEYKILSNKYTAEKAFARNVIAILVFLAAVFVIIIINLLIHRVKKSDDHFDDDPFDGGDGPGEETYFGEDGLSGKDTDRERGALGNDPEPLKDEPSDEEDWIDEEDWDEEGWDEENWDEPSDWEVKPVRKDGPEKKGGHGVKGGLGVKDGPVDGKEAQPVEEEIKDTDEKADEKDKGGWSIDDYREETVTPVKRKAKETASAKETTSAKESRKLTEDEIEEAQRRKAREMFFAGEPAEEGKGKKKKASKGKIASDVENNSGKPEAEVLDLNDL